MSAVQPYYIRVCLSVRERDRLVMRLHQTRRASVSTMDEVSLAAGVVAAVGEHQAHRGRGVVGRTRTSPRVCGVCQPLLERPFSLFSCLAETWSLD